MTRKGLWLAATMFAGVSAPATAATCMWTGTTSASWDTMARWSCGAVPGANDDVFIASGGLTFVSTGTRTANTMTIDSGGEFSIGPSGQFALVGSSLALNGIFTNGGSFYNNYAGGWQQLSGTGKFVMTGSSFGTNLSYARTVIGPGITVSGFGNIGNGSVMFNNAGLIHATNGTMSINPYGGRTGSSLSGIGTGSNVTFLNGGTLRAERTVGTSGTATLSLGDGLYENGDGSVMEALASGQLLMITNANLLNLGATGVLSKGTYRAIGGGVLALRSYQGAGGTAVTGITTIGTAATSTDTIVELSGNPSQIVVGASGETTLSGTLATIARSGQLIIGGGATFTSSPNIFHISGKLTLGNTAGQGTAALKQVVVGATGEIVGFGYFTAPSGITNTGTIRASGGALAIGTSTGSVGGAGTLASDSGATLSLADVSSTVTAGTLINNGSLALGNRNLTVSSDYQNAAFGSGAGFDRRANVTGTGVINAVVGTSYAIRLADGNARSGTIALGSIRVGDIVPLAQIANTSTTAITLRGAAYSDLATRYTVDNASWALAQGATSVVKLTALSGGALNQLMTTKSNFANVTAQTAGFTASVYQAAIARSQSASIDLGSARIGGTLSQAFTFGNVAPNVANYSEALISGATASGEFRIGGGTNLITNAMAPGATSGSTLSLLTNAAGAFTGTLGVANTSQAVAGSGLSNLNLASQSIALSGKIYQSAVSAGQIFPIDLVSRIGDAAPTVGLTVANAATAADLSYVEQMRTLATLTGSAFRLNGSTAALTTTTAPGGSQVITLSQLTTAPGLSTGSLQLEHTTLAIMGSGLTDQKILTQVVNINGRVFRAAAADVVPTSLSFASARVGDAAATASLSLRNIAAASGGYTETLRTTASASSGFLVDGATSAVATNAVGASSVTQLAMATDVAGLKSGTLSLASVSTAIGNSGLADLNLASQTVALSGAVYQAAALWGVSSLVLNARVGGSGATSYAFGNSSTGPAGYVESLRLTGTVSGNFAGSGGTVTVAGGANDAFALSMNTATAGAKSGLLTLSNVTSLAVGGSGLSDLALAGKTVNLSGSVYAAAVSGTSTAPLTFASARVGGSGSTLTLATSNTAAASSGFTESLMTNIATSAGFAPATTSVTNTVGQSTNTMLSMDALTAGVKTGTVTLTNISKAFAGSGLSDLALGQQVIHVSGAVYQAAALSGANSLTFNTRVGGSGAISYAFGNSSTGPAGYVESLRLSGAASGNFTGSGTRTVSGGASNSIALTMNAATAGARTGTLALSSVTSLAAAGSGLSDLALANKSVALTGAVYQPAIARTQPASITMASRVGGTASQAFTFGNTAAEVSGYTETLTSSATTSGIFRVGGGTTAAASSLSGGATATVPLSMITTTAGTFSGSIGLVNTSVAIAGSGLADLALGGQSVALTGKVYAPALAQVSALAVDLGYVRPGEGKAGSVTLTNGATGALTDRLVTTASGSNGFNAGTAADLSQGQSTTLGLTFGGSAVSGVKTGTVDLSFTSRNPDMADLALAGQQVNVTATVTELAKASLFKAGGSGTLTGSGTSYTLNLGNVWYKAGTLTTNFGLTNAIAANSWSENLGGSWTALSGSSAYSFSSEAIGLIAAGASIQNGILSFVTANQSLGAYLTSFEFKPVSKMNGMSDAQQEKIQVNVLANLIAVPEPAVWAQLIAGFGLLGGVARRRRLVLV